jgi:hypothetical protein
MEQTKLGVAIGLVIANNQPAVVKLINKHGGNITRNTPKDKVYQLVKSFITSNAKFTREFLELLLAKNYLNPLDFETKGQIDGTGKEYSSFAIGGILSGISGAVGGAIPLVQNFLKKPETDSTAINTILEIEAEKQKRAQQSNAKYWVIGGAIVGLLVLTTVVIIKKSK